MPPSNCWSRPARKHPCRRRHPGRPSNRRRPRAISQKQWSAAELDLDSLDLDEELARLEQREIQPTTEFGRHREDTLSARRDSAESDEAPWPDSLFSESAADRAQAADTLDATRCTRYPGAPERAEQTRAHRTVAVPGTGGPGR